MINIYLKYFLGRLINGKGVADDKRRGHIQAKNVYYFVPVYDFYFGIYAPDIIKESYSIKF